MYNFVTGIKLCVRSSCLWQWHPCSVQFCNGEYWDIRCQW